MHRPHRGGDMTKQSSPTLNDWADLIERGFAMVDGQAFGDYWALRYSPPEFDRTFFLACAIGSARVGVLGYVPDHTLINSTEWDQWQEHQRWINEPLSEEASFDLAHEIEKRGLVTAHYRVEDLWSRLHSNAGSLSDVLIVLNDALELSIPGIVHILRDAHQRGEEGKS